ncbi:MAG: aminopeptidase P N-terminal domain-containing protein [Pseudomonadota bacterium]|nr:aminopeptidase P N-terminal domain-containing protein [Pseudomonadota bacterium]
MSAEQGALAAHARRRQELLQLLEPGSIAIIPAAHERRRNRDVHYPFRQDSDFDYLTGFPEPDALAVLAPDREGGPYLLFVREKDPEREQWDGYRAGPQGACREFGADAAWSIGELDEVLPELLLRAERVYYALGNDAALDQRLIGWLRELREGARAGRQAPGALVALEPHLHEMRLYKDPAEQALMRRAGAWTAAAHAEAMAVCRPGQHEYELAAVFTAAFARHGGEHAYPPIVGGGPRGCILHYVRNDAPLVDGELVLIDAGMEYAGYAADVTRTFPVNGRFSPAQQAVYEVVLAAQLAAIEAVRPGAHWNAPHEAAVQVLSQGLIDLGILTEALDDVVNRQLYRPYYMHRTGHWLGRDVHDVGSYRIDEAWRELEPGMTLTVEPGLYLQQGPALDERWWNIGVRIEDDVLVTRRGAQVLTAEAPKTVAEVTAACCR